MLAPAIKEHREAPGGGRRASTLNGIRNSRYHPSCGCHTRSSRPAGSHSAFVKHELDSIGENFEIKYKSSRQKIIAFLEKWTDTIIREN